MTLSVAIHASIAATQTKAGSLSFGQADIGASITQALSDGTGINQADRIWKSVRTLAASAAESLDVSGAMVDDFGDAALFARIKAVLVIADGGNTNNVNVTRPASNGVPWLIAAGDGVALKPGAFILWSDPSAAGVAVTAGTGDLMTFTNSAGTTSVAYTLVVVGASA